MKNIINTSERIVKFMIGVITEFNPFHKGHEYFLAEAKRLAGCDTLACVMSGDFVQRGEPAVFDKFSRASQAVKNGADLVVELPLPWSLSSAEYFAKGGVSILEALGADCIAFGSECGDIDALTECKQRILYEESGIKEYMQLHPEMNYPSARREVIGSELLDYPNNLLGIEYLKAASVPCITVKRENSEHDGFNSAKEIRDEMKTLGLGVNYAALDLAAVSRLRMFGKEYFNNLPDSEDGIGNRLYEAVREENAVEAICSAAKTKSVTLSAVRRLLWCAVLGVEKGLNENAPPYIRVLAFNEKGREILKNETKLPVISNPRQVFDLDAFAQKVFALGASANDLHKLGFIGKTEQNCGEDYRKSPIIV